jgi:L-rhamnose mutarotase
MKLTVMKTIQEFKRTHQDRWDEFKEKFNKAQLEDLQGAGAAHYYA